MENNGKLDWKPEVGDVVWRFLRGDGMRLKAFRIKSFYRFADGDKYALLEMDDTQWPIQLDSIFPTPEAALTSIRVYDLEGKEVLIPRASVENSETPMKLSKEREMQLLNLAIAYGDADYQQKDGADRAWHYVAEAREKLIAFVENREPELNDDY